MKHIPIGAVVDATTLRFEEGYECPSIHITEHVEHPTRFYCNEEEGIGIEFAYTEYVGNADPTSTDNEFSLREHQIRAWHMPE